MSDRWPALDYAGWAETQHHLHLLTQIVGKVRLAHTPWINHSWHVTLYPTTRGLTTGPIPAAVDVQLDFDFVDDALIVASARVTGANCRCAKEVSLTRTMRSWRR